MSDCCLPRNFQKNALSQNLLLIPGIDNNHCLILNKEGIATGSQFVGCFFRIDRDYNVFLEFLLNIGFQQENATQCASAIHDKFKNV